LQGISDMRRAVEVSDPSENTAGLYGVDLWFLIADFVGWAEQIRGNLEEARLWIEKVHQMLIHHTHAYSKAWNVMGMSTFRHIRREMQAARDLADVAISLSSEMSFRQPLGMSTFYSICARCALGQSHDVGAEMIKAIAILDESWGGEVMATLLLGIHANICLKLNLVSIASESLRRGTELAEKNGELMFLAELHRLQGELFLRKEEPDLTRAEQSFRQAIRLAQEQGAKLWSCERQSAWPDCSRSRASAKMHARCSPTSTTGSPKASTPPT